MTRLIRAELSKLRKRSLTWILLYVLIGLVVVFHLLLYVISRITIPGQNFPGRIDLQSLLALPSAIPFALTMLSSIGAVLAAILVASSVGNEYNWRTIRIALISSESRLKFLGAKLISLVIFILIGMLIGVATGFVMGLITTAIGGNSFDFSFATGGYFWDQFVQFWRTFFVLLPFISLGALFALVGRSATPGIGLGIGILFLEPIITSFMDLAENWVNQIPKYLFNANVDAINALSGLPLPSGGFGEGFGRAATQATAAHAFAVLSVYIVVFIGMSFYLFRKRDVTG